MVNIQRAALVSTLWVSAACSTDSPDKMVLPAVMPPTSAPMAGMGGASVPAATAGVGGAAPMGIAGSAPIGTAGSEPPMTAGTGGTSPPSTSGTGGTELPPTGGMSGSAGMESMAGAAGTSTMDPECEKGTVAAEEVVFIGESFIALSNAIPRFTSELAREAGTIEAGESYRSYAVSGTQLTTGAIPDQYDRAVDEGPVKVVLMDGGGNDLLIGGRCQGTFDSGCEEIVSVVQALFATMKAGGVKDVVYFFYPDPMGIGAGIKDAMDILRPEMKKACDEATDVRCIWVDQRETWDGNYGSYTMDGIHPTDAGSMASAQQIWDAMVEHCIAQ